MNNVANKKVAYFTGCFANYYYPEVGEATLAIMRQSEVAVVVPSQVCCGLPMMAKGNLKDAISSMKHNVASLSRLVADGYSVITTCSSCGLFLKRDFPHFLDTDEARLVSANLYHFSEYLLKLHEIGELNTDFRRSEQSVFFHTPCHLRAQQIGNPSVRLLEMFVNDGKGPMPLHKKMIESIKTMGNPLEEPSAKRIDVYPSSFKKQDHAETLLFFGCITSYQDVNIIPSTLQIMERVGIDFTALGAEENCCGYIAHLIGAIEDFEKCKKKNIDSISKIEPKQLVTTCAGCFRTFKELYPEEVFNGVHVLHSVQYIEDLVKDGRIQFKTLPTQKVAYHDPCDLGRHLGVFEQPRNILKRIPGVELIEFESNRYNAVCCGAGGGYKAVNLEKSLEVASKRVAAAASVGAKVIISACPSCKSNLQLAAAKGRKEGKWKIRVIDITEFVAEAMTGS